MLNQSSTGSTEASPVAVPCQVAATNTSLVERAEQSMPNSEGIIGQRKMLEQNELIFTTSLKILCLDMVCLVL